ncbi:MAG: hypothetical protein LBL66_00600 [Clostridiales bacterium]|jgi:hypothetical protein|nr:hypothetical protein [Clostridiales bacterium]
MKKLLLAFAAAALCACALFGCFGTVINPRDPDKKELVVSVYNGGQGTEFIAPVVERFKKDNPEWNVLLETRKRTVGEIVDLTAIGQQANLYISPVVDFYSLIYKDAFTDLSGVMEMKAPGEDRTIGEKMLRKEDWLNIAAKDGAGCYMLPWGEDFLGLNYDHGKFLEYGLLREAADEPAVKEALAAQGISFTEQGAKLKFASAPGETNYKPGDTILRAGKDGKYGTYDDGQPVTLAEWKQMFDLLKGYGKAVIYSGKILDYVTDIFNGVFGQYDGIDAVRTFNAYDGAYTFAGDSNPTAITMQNGYKVYGMTGLQKATEFLQAYMNDREYAHEACFISEESHTDAQGKFVTGAAKTSPNSPFTGFLADGTWWENEARPVFAALSAGAGKTDGYGYGERDYRVMMLPEMPGQKGADGQGNGSVLSIRATGSIVLPKSKNAEADEMAKRFITYLLSEESLRNFTALTGGLQPYSFELTAGDKAKMSNYARTVQQIYNDADNVAFVRMLRDKNLTPLPYKTSKGDSVIYLTKIGSVSYNNIVTALRLAETNLDASIKSDPVKAVFEGIQKHYEPLWQGYIKEVAA